MPKMKPVLLVVLDGWGLRAQREANAIAIAGTPNMDALARDYPHAALETSGLSVGLPEGQMGNSEVGHTNLGAGRIVYQDLVRINRAIEDGSFFKNDALLAGRPARPRSRAARSTCWASSPTAASTATSTTCTPASSWPAARAWPRSSCTPSWTAGTRRPGRASSYMRQVENRLKETGYGKVATVCGRYFAMDRDKRWDRVAARLRRPW